VAVHGWSRSRGAGIGHGNRRPEAVVLGTICCRSISQPTPFMLGSQPGWWAASAAACPGAATRWPGAEAARANQPALPGRRWRHGQCPSEPAAPGGGFPVGLHLRLEERWLDQAGCPLPRPSGRTRQAAALAAPSRLESQVNGLAG